MKYTQLFYVLIYIISFPVMSQLGVDNSRISEVVLLQDTVDYSWRGDRVLYGGKYHLPFEYRNESEVMEVNVYLEAGYSPEIELLPSADFQLMDSIFQVGQLVRFKVRFRELSSAERVRFTFQMTEDNRVSLIDIPLFPYTSTYAAYYPPEGELYVGEEKITEVTTNHPDNIIIDQRWTTGLSINYRMKKRNGKVFLHLAPNRLGKHSIEIPIKLKKPIIKQGRIIRELDPIQHTFTVKAGKLTFLQMNQQEITPNDDPKEPVEVQIENHYSLKVGKTYRLENQEEKGGALIGELFTKTLLNNNKVLCLFRPYALHRQSEGYLYIKDGDRPVFVTSVDVTPQTKITSIYVLREGKDWERTNRIFPGEHVSIRLEGDGIHKSNFQFPGIAYTPTDSLVRNENFAFFDIKVPKDIRARRVEILNHSDNTGKHLQVTERQLPREFDYISLRLSGKSTYHVSKLERPIYYEESLSDLVIAFDRKKIDQSELYGQQHLTIKVKISNKQGNLIELYQFDDLVICPGENSVRSAYYEGGKCFTGHINLNNYISRKTYNLEEWSRIELEIAHVTDKYPNGARRKKIQIYLKRKYNFDIDVSFPGGLLILKAGENEFANFSGVSFAMMGQFSFYKEGKIARYQPYKVGAGFIAIDAFNFSENSENRDVGLVIIGSVHPNSNNPNRKLTFPLYVGFGYLMKERQFFSLVGPGIRVRF